MASRRLPCSVRSSLALASLLPVACASSSTKPPEAPLVASPPPLPPPPELAAVPIPQNLVLFARLAKPAATLRTLTDWAALPGLDPMLLIDHALENFTEAKKNGRLASVVDPALPVEVAATFEAKLGTLPLYAVAFGLKSLDDARSKLGATYDLTPGDNGIIHLEVRPEARADNQKLDDGDGVRPCEIAPAFGAAAYRLVCGSTHEALTALAPYLTRTAPRLVLAADVHVELHAQPLGSLPALGRIQGPAILSAMLGLNSTTEPATLELVTAGLGDLFDYAGDLDTLTLDATAETARGTASMRTSFKTAHSLLAKLSTEHPDRVDVPPAAFGRLPADVDLASFSSGLDSSELQHARDLAVAALREQLKLANVGEGDRQALAEVVKENLRAPRSVIAHGLDGDTPYWLVEWEEPASRPQQMARDTVAALARPGVARWLVANAPKGTQPPVWRLAPPIAGVPAGSLHVQVTLPATPPASKSSRAGAPAAGPPLRSGRSKAVTYDLVIAPDGPRTWLAFSTKEATVRAKLAAVLGQGGGANDALKPFKDSHMSSGGYFTVRSLLELARDSTTGIGNTSEVPWDEVVRSLFDNGSDPIVFTSAPGAPTAADPGGSRDIEISLPASAVRDAARLGALLREKQRANRPLSAPRE